jgi:acyl-CoA synthetase (AMP-forming)/AMP-acid ligase II
MEIESAIVGHESVAECAVVGRPDELKGQGIVAFVTLKKEVNKSHNNLKTNENWTFTDAHLNYLAHFEKECLENLKQYSKAHYSLHIANFDEVLTFDTMFDYLKENNVPNKLYYYNTNHRFETVNELLENIKSELISK